MSRSPSGPLISAKVLRRASSTATASRSATPIRSEAIIQLFGTVIQTERSRLAGIQSESVSNCPPMSVTSDQLIPSAVQRTRMVTAMRNIESAVATPRGSMRATMSNATKPPRRKAVGGHQAGRPQHQEARCLLGPGQGVVLDIAPEDLHEEGSDHQPKADGPDPAANRQKRVVDQAQPVAKGKQCGHVSSLRPPLSGGVSAGEASVPSLCKYQRFTLLQGQPRDQRHDDQMIAPVVHGVAAAIEPGNGARQDRHTFGIGAPFKAGESLSLTREAARPVSLLLPEDMDGKMLGSGKERITLLGFAGDHSTSGGSRERLEKPFAVNATGPSGPMVVTSVIPVAKRPSASRKRREVSALGTIPCPVMEPSAITRPRAPGPASEARTRSGGPSEPSVHP